MPGKFKNTIIVKFIQNVFEKLIYSLSIYTNYQTSLINLYNQNVNQNELNLKKESALGLLQQELVKSDLVYRVGSELDGGYVMGKVSNQKYAISIGVGRDVSWDEAIAKQGITVHMFDHTVKKPPTSFKNSQFYKIGIRSSKINKSRKLLLLEEILHKIGLADNKNLILKIDIEGAEWDILAEIDALSLTKFDFIIIEFHDLDLSNLKQREILAKLKINHGIIHVNPNNYSKILSFEGYLIPSVLEITYVKKEVLKNYQGSDYSTLTYKNDSRVPSFSNKVFRLPS